MKGFSFLSYLTDKNGGNREIMLMRLGMRILHRVHDVLHCGQPVKKILMERKGRSEIYCFNSHVMSVHLRSMIPSGVPR